MPQIIYSIILGSIIFSCFSLNFVLAEEYIVTIPFGAYNPELNTPAEVWFDPPKINIRAGDTITWYNDDREGHTITSGKGSGRFGWMGDDFGTPNGIFDSGRFLPNNSWSYTFNEAKTFQYFCTIHPWMEGIVVVEKLIPDFPHDATGQKLEFPLAAYTPDRAIEVNLTWEPHVIKTHELVKFIYQFYDPQTNSNLAKMQYDITIFQNGQEIFKDTGVNQIGGDFRNFVFEKEGSIIIRIAGIESSAILAEETTTVGGTNLQKAQRSVDFTAVVYENPEKTTHEVYHVKPAQRLEFYYELAILIILVPVALLVVLIVWMKRGPKQVIEPSTPI